MKPCNTKSGPRSPKDEAPAASDLSVRYLSCGDTAFTVEFGNEISPEINGRVMALQAALTTHGLLGT